MPATRPRSLADQHDPLSGRRRRAEGELRPSRAADGRRGDGLRAVDAPPEARSRRPALARSRSLRAVGRSRLDAALSPAAPDRLRPLARRPPEASASGAAARPDTRRVTSRPASRRRPGRSARASRNAVGHGHRRGAPRRPLQSARPRRRRPPHLRAGERRRPDGGRRLRGLLARGTPRPRQAHRPLRRQPHLASRARHRCASPRTSARASPPTAGTCSACDDGNDVAAVDARSRRARERSRPAVAHPRPHRSSATARPHKQGTFEAHGSPARPRRGARREGEPRLADRARVLHSARRSLAHFRDAMRAARPPSDAWSERLAAYARGVSRARRRSSGGAIAASCRRLGRRTSPAFPADAKGLATRKASEAVMQRARRRAAGARRRLGATSIRRRSPGSRGTGDFEPAAPDRTACRARSAVPGVTTGRNLHFGVREHAMGAVVNGLALHGGFIPYGSTFLVFSRLHASRRPPLGAHRGSARSGSTRTTASASARTARRISRSSTTSRCARFPTCCSSGPATPTRPRCAWQVAIESRHRPDRARAHAPERADARPRALRVRRRRCAAAPTC